MPLCINAYKELRQKLSNQTHIDIEHLRNSLNPLSSQGGSNEGDTSGLLTDAVNRSSSSPGVFSANASFTLIDNQTNRQINDTSVLSTDVTMVIHEYQLIKAVVLIIVLTVLMLSACKFILQSSAKHAQSKDEQAWHTWLIVIQSQIIR